MSITSVFLNMIAFTLIVMGIVCYGLILMFDLVFARSNPFVEGFE